VPFESVRGNRCYYEEKGRGDAVILVHGYTGSSSDWETTLPAVGEKYRCVMFDQRGFGKSDSSDSPAAYHMREYVEDIAALASQLGIDRFHLAGVSMGGMIVQEFALAYQERLLSLALVDTAPKLPDMLAGFIRPDITEQFLKDHTVEQYWDFNQKRRAEAFPPPGPPSTPEMSEAARQRFIELNTPAGLVGGARLLESWPGTYDRLGTVTVRTLVTVGDNDEPFVGPSKEMARLIPNARLVVIPECGHVPMFDAPEFFNRTYLEFLAES